jgi:large subunit ribosomal protein L4
MAVVDVFNLKNEKISEVELTDDIFNVPLKKHVLHQVVVSQLAGRRAGTAAAKGRSAVKGSGAKLWRQKGTGRARVGAASSPTRKGGGVAFGPSPRKYDKKVSKKTRRSALKMALSDKLRSEQLIVLDAFTMPEIKTKNFVGVMKNFDVKKALIVTEDKKENLEMSSRNVPWVKIMRCEGLNVYDIMTHEHLFLEQAAIGKIQEALIS